MITQAASGWPGDNSNLYSRAGSVLLHKNPHTKSQTHTIKQTTNHTQRIGRFLRHLRPPNEQLTHESNRQIQPTNSINPIQIIIKYYFQIEIQIIVMLKCWNYRNPVLNEANENYYYVPQARNDSCKAAQEIEQLKSRL